MGLNSETTDNSGSMVFLTPINLDSGIMWARRVTEDFDGAREREAKCGQVFEVYYQSVTGFIKSVRIVDKGEYGEELEIAMDDDDPDSGLTFILQAGFASDIGKAFICRMQNIDNREPILIGIFTSDEGKRILYAKQGDNKVGNAFLKDNAEGNQLPAPVKSEGRGGKVSYNWEAHENGLYGVCKTESEKNGWSTADEFRVSFCKRSEKVAVKAPAPEPEKEEYAEEEDDFEF